MTRRHRQALHLLGRLVPFVALLAVVLMRRLVAGRNQGQGLARESASSKVKVRDASQSGFTPSTDESSPSNGSKKSANKHSRSEYRSFVATLIFIYIGSLTGMIFLIQQRALIWPFQIYTPAVIGLFGLLFGISLGVSGPVDRSHVLGRLAMPRAVFGQALIFGSLVFAFIFQSQFTTRIKDTYVPSLAIISDESIGDRLSVSIVTSVDSPYLLCSTTTEVRVELPPEVQWRRGQIIGVGIGSIQDLGSVHVSFEGNLKGEPEPPAVVSRTSSFDSVSLALKVEEPPAAPYGFSPAALLLKIEADWAEPRGFGACDAVLPSLSPEDHGDFMAREALDRAGVDSSRYAAHSLLEGRSEFAGGINVLRGEARPSPNAAHEDVWTCRPDVGSDAVDACAAVVPTEDPAAANLRSGLLLLCGTVLAFGLQVVYDAVSSRQVRSSETA